MERRNFINLGIVGAGYSLVMPGIAMAKKNQNLAGGIYFTEKSQGRWEGKAAGHLPNIKIKDVDGKITVNVTTTHGMDGYKHYIVKHVLLDQNYKYIDEKMFDPMKDKVPTSTFTLKNYKG